MMFSRFGCFGVAIVLGIVLRLRRRARKCSAAAARSADRRRPKRAAPAATPPPAARSTPAARPRATRSARPTRPGRRSSRRTASSSTSPSSSSTAATASRAAARRNRRWGRSIARGPGHLSRHQLLPGTRAEIRRVGRLRAGLRDRARIRPSHPEFARHVGPSLVAPAPVERDRRQQAVGDARTPGRLLRRRVGGEEPRPDGPRRSRRRHDRGQGDRRRHAAEAKCRAASFPTASPTARRNSA